MIEPIIVPFRYTLADIRGSPSVGASGPKPRTVPDTEPVWEKINEINNGKMSGTSMH